MYANNVELLFWPDRQRLAQWMHADKIRRDEESDDMRDPTANRLITGAHTYEEALAIIRGQFHTNGITVDPELMEGMVEAVKEKDKEDHAEPDEQVFLGILLNTVH